MNNVKSFPPEWNEFDSNNCGIQPDWNQNDNTKPDYVKNRTHYVEKVTVLERQLMTATPHQKKP